MSESSPTPRLERPETRPRVEIESEHTPASINRRVKAALRQSREVVGQVFPGRIELTVPGKDTHLWSPQLIADVVSHEGGARIKGRFAPHPHVWTMYVGACAIASMATFGALVLAFAQWIMNERLWGLWVAPGFALLAGLTFGAAFVGQGLSTQQMFLLRDFLRAALEGPEPDPADEPASHAWRG